MSTDNSQFVAIAAEFLLDRLAPLLRGRLASDTRADSGSIAMRARIAAWLDDLQAGRVEAALDPMRLAGALETLWMLSIVGVLAPRGNADARYVDIALRPEDAAALNLAVAAVTALDALRGSTAIATFRNAQRNMAEEFAAMICAQTDSQAAV